MANESTREPSETTGEPSPPTSPEPSPELSDSESAESCSSPPPPTAASSSPRRSSKPKAMPEALLQLHEIDQPEEQEIRLEDDPDALQELAESLRDDGQLNPITVRRDGQRFALVAGRRRLKAAAALGWESIRATILPDDGTSRRGVTIIENMQRRDLSPVEEANALGDLFEDLAHDINAVARKVSRSPQFVAERLELLTWTPELMQAVHDRTLSMAAARALAKIPDPRTRDEYTRQAIASGISADMARSWLAQAKQAQQSAAPVSQDELPPPIEQPRYVMTCNCGLCQQVVEVPKSTKLVLCLECAAQLRASLNSG